MENLDSWETELEDIIAGFDSDPLGYVLFNFPWGEQGQLELFDGPRQWQRDFLKEWGQEIKLRGFDGVTPTEPIEFSTSSGHGIGKSALSAWIIKFIHDCWPFSKGAVTANTGEQLKTKTWAELGKWHNMSLTAHWSKWSNTRGNMSLVNLDNPESWRVDATTCREENSEAFAGLHAVTSVPFYLFDEASAIPDKIWEVSDGGMTDGQPMRFSFGNPTRNTGRFRANFGARRDDISCRRIDSRDVDGTNKALFAKWVKLYGEDSDFVRVRVRGVFPRASSMQFIGTDVAEAASLREGRSSISDPLVMAVDVARFGDDCSVIYWRRGRDAKTIEPIKFRGMDTMTLASKVIELSKGTPHTNGMAADGIFVDGGGVGGGVIDRCRMLGTPVIEVQFGSKPTGSFITEADGEKYSNKRSEMWGLMRTWLKYGAIVEDQELIDDLTGCEYGFNAKNEIQIEKKEDMKRRGLASPDIGDALAMTFAEPVFKVDDAFINQHNSQDNEYDPLA